MSQPEPDLAAASLDFGTFLRRYARIRDVATDGTGRLIPWEWWPYHAELLRDLTQEQRLIGLKARQLGLSWCLAALHVWDALFSSHYLGGVVSAGELEAAEFLDKCRFVLNNMPTETLPTLPVNNAGEITIKGGGTILAFPSTAKAGRGFAFNRFVADEAAFHDHAEANYSAYEPATEHGQIIIVSSTAAEEGEGRRAVAPNDWFRRMWYGAPGNGFTARFWGWRLRPGRDGAWEAKQRARLSSRPGAFEREYPDTPEEAFRSILGLRYDAEAIKRGLEACRAPMERVSGFPEGVVGPGLSVWGTPRPGIPYVAYTDPAEGVGRDYSASVILEARTLRHVLTWRDNWREPTEHGALFSRLCRHYNEALWGVERNSGASILYAAGQSGYLRLYRHVDELRSPRERERRTVGFPVTAQTRVGLIDDLGQVIGDGSLDSPDAVFWGECGTFVEEGRASAGAHDDLVLAMAGAVRMARQPGAQVMGPAGDLLRVMVTR